MKRPFPRWLLIFTVLFFALIPFSFALSIDYTPVAIGAIITGMVLGAAYMVANMIGSPTLIAWVHNEVYESVFAAILIVLVVAFVFGSYNMLSLLTGHANMDGYVKSATQQASNSLFMDMEDTIVVGSRITMLGSYYYSRTFGYILYSSQMAGPYLGLSSQNGVLFQLASALTRGIIFYHLMEMAYFFFQAIGPTLLVAGFVCRIFPFTRQVGSVLMAIGVAVVIVYPYAFALGTTLRKSIEQKAAADNWPLHSQVTSDDLHEITLKLPSKLVTFICKNTFLRTFTSMTEVGFWLLICLPFCAASCAVSTLAYAVCFGLCFPMITGGCWHYTYIMFNALQFAAMVGGTAAALTAASVAKHNIPDASKIYYVIVMKHLVTPCLIASYLPIMEFVFVAGMTVLSIRALTQLFGGTMNVLGMGSIV